MKKQIVTIEGNMLQIVYPTIGKRFTADLTKYPEQIHEDARLHGFKQKFGDAASGGEPADKFAMVQRIHSALLEGNWELTDRTRDTSAAVIEAVHFLKHIPVEKLQAVIAAKPELLTEWRSNVRVKAEMLRIAAARAAKAAKEDDTDIEIKL